MQGGSLYHFYDGLCFFLFADWCFLIGGLHPDVAHHTAGADHEHPRQPAGAVPRLGAAPYTGTQSAADSCVQSGAQTNGGPTRSAHQTHRSISLKYDSKIIIILII